MSLKNKIIQMRKRNAFLLTLVKEYAFWNPFLDEEICLCGVLSILDNVKLAVSRNEVRTAFNKFYSKEFHGDKKSYLAWLYSAFNIKKNTKVFTAQVRKNPLLPRISAINNAYKSPKISFSTSNTLNTTEAVK